jgi:hypothetical protein
MRDDAQLCCCNEILPVLLKMAAGQRIELKPEQEYPCVLFCSNLHFVSYRFTRLVAVRFTNSNIQLSLHHITDFSR